MTTRRVFLSCVTRELGQYRERLANDLDLPDIKVQFQEHFVGQGFKLLDKLDAYIKDDCDAVLHLVGDAMGAIPQPEEVQTLHSRHQDLLDRLPQLSTESLPTLSYTQWEAWLAIYHRKPCHIFRADSDAPCQADYTSNPEDRTSQEQHWQRIVQSGHEWGSFSGLDHLSKQILRNLNVLLPGPKIETIVHLSGLPTLQGELVFQNRDQQKTLLANAWEEGSFNVIVFVAQGGVGKTALVKNWLSGVAERGVPEGTRVLTYSFDSDQATPDDILAAALRDCGVADQKHPRSPLERGQLLARRVRETRTLLVLDAVERIQVPKGAGRAKIGDPGFAALLTDLASVNPGLCIVTTRQGIMDLESTMDKTAREEDLEYLATEDAVRVLRSWGITGNEQELVAACRHYQGHCLALQLLAAYLKECYEGRIESWQEADLFAGDEYAEDEEDSNPAEQMLEPYEKWLREPELEMLRIVAVFDRAVKRGEFNSLLSPPKIEGLNSVLSTFSLPKIRKVRQRLVTLKLLWWNEESKEYDGHPLVRQFFQTRFATGYPQSWREANNRLYEKFFHDPDKQELHWLVETVRYGCHAERHVEAFRDVFWTQIRRNEMEGISDYTRRQNYSLRVLGRYSSDLQALREFFSERFHSVKPGFDSIEEVKILTEAGSLLRALGRFEEAEAPLKQALYRGSQYGDIAGAAEAGGNLGELQVRMGKLSAAVEAGRHAVEQADKLGGDPIPYMRIVMRGVLGNALHLSGKVDEALAVFAESESLQAQHDPGKPKLYGIQGFEFWDCLLSGGRYSEVEARAEATKSWLNESWHVQKGLCYLVDGLARLKMAEANGGDNLATSSDLLEEALTELNASGRSEYIPRGYLALSHLRRVQGKFEEGSAQLFEQAASHLKEAFALIQAQGLPLYEVDAHLEMARLSLATNRRADCQEHLAAARHGINNTGYRVRESVADELSRLCQS